MTPSRLLIALVLGSSAFSMVACSGPTGEIDDSDTQEDSVKKKVKPKGGNGAFELLAPGFDATDFAGTFRFDNAPLKAGERSEKVPGTYSLVGVGTSTSNGLLLAQRRSFDLTAGAITKHKLGGLRVRFSEPVTLGSTRVELNPEDGTSGRLAETGGWVTSPTGASMLVLAGKVVVSAGTNPTPVEAIIAEGALKEVVLPTSRVALLVDAYDPAYPTTPSCPATFLLAGAPSALAAAPVRKGDGSPNASFVVPQGSRAPVTINAYGIEVSQPTVAGQTHTFTLNRLEIDDVEVQLASGGTQLVKGTVRVARKNEAGGFVPLNCTFSTHGGIDLPNGVYRVTSSAQSPSGLVTSEEEVTFP